MAYWFVSSKGEVLNGSNELKLKAKKRMAFGNFFRTKKMAIEAKIRIAKLFKRLEKVKGKKK